MYKKVKESKYPYQYKSRVADWLGTPEGNESFREALIKDGDQVRQQLSQPESQLIVNFDLIEVKDGWCFSINQETFLKEAVGEGKVGKVSPRAFVAYDHFTLLQPNTRKQSTEAEGAAILRRFHESSQIQPENT